MFRPEKRKRVLLRYNHIMKQQFPDESPEFLDDLAVAVINAIELVFLQKGIDQPDDQVPDIDRGEDPLRAEDEDDQPQDFILLDPRGEPRRPGPVARPSRNGRPK